MKAELMIKQTRLIDPDEAEFDLLMTNTGGQEEIVWVTELNFPSLFVKVTKSDGEILNNLPPPVPNDDSSSKRIFKPGEKEIFHFTGIPVDHSFLKRGNYKVRVDVELSTGENRTKKIQVTSSEVLIEIAED